MLEDSFRPANPEESQQIAALAVPNSPRSSDRQVYTLIIKADMRIRHRYRFCRHIASRST